MALIMPIYLVMRRTEGAIMALTKKNAIVITFLLIGMLGLAGLKLFQAQIGDRVISRVVNAKVGRDVAATLPDGLHVGLCGTSSPLPNPKRAEACNIIIAGKHMYVVDIGDAAPRNIVFMGLLPGEIDGLFLTHFHSDHINGMGPLLLMRWTGGSHSTPLPVYGPSGVDKVVAGFNAAYALDYGFRTAHHGPQIVPPSGAGAIAYSFNFQTSNANETKVVLEKDGLKVTAFRVNHGPIEPSVGYRFDYKGRSVVISGDTSKSDTLAMAAKDADLLVHEAISPKLVGMMTNALAAKHIYNTAQITRDILNYHTTPIEAAQSAKAANVQQLVLSHIAPAIPTRFFYPSFLDGARNHFSGKIIVGEDGMLFSMPAGGRDIEQIQLIE